MTSGRRKLADAAAAAVSSLYHMDILIWRKRRWE